MPPTSADNPTTTQQRRLKRFVRQPDRLPNRQLTPKGLQMLAAIERYRLLPTSMLERMVPGDRSNNNKHLQTLFHKNLASRFALTTRWGTPGEFVYYLDSAASLNVLQEHGLIELSAQEREQHLAIIRYNREKNWANMRMDPDQENKLLFIQHELMVSRFHFLLEMACRHPKLAPHVSLEQWKQGPELWNSVDVPAVRMDNGELVELARTKRLPHRPDAFFTLRFPGNPEDQQFSHFLYEADRRRERTARFQVKLRAHYHYIVKQQRNRQAPYNVQRIRAVLTETITTKWRDALRKAAAHPIVSKTPSPLFWFASSEELTASVQEGKKTVPRYLVQPEIIFTPIWRSCVDDKTFKLPD